MMHSTNAASQPTNWFNAIVAHVHVQPTHKGEVWITCPNCSAKARKFSVSERGAHCFKCGYNPPLKALAEKLGILDARPYAAPVYRPKPIKRQPWQERGSQLAADFAATPGALQKWQAYKPVSRDTFKRAELGYGPWPGGLAYETDSGWSRCHHPRLIVPLFDRAKVVGFRCRAVECDCPKWLSPGGSHLTLYGAQWLRPGSDVLVIAENPIDALLVRQEWEGQAVATLGVSIWRDEYTVQVMQASPAQVVVWFDNDSPGQTTNPDILAEWNIKHPNIKPPLNGIKLTNRLLDAGLNATFYRWPNDAESGADIGGFFK